MELTALEDYGHDSVQIFHLCMRTLRNQSGTHCWVYQIVVESIDLCITWVLYEGTLEESLRSQYQDHYSSISLEDQLYF